MNRGKNLPAQTFSEIVEAGQERKRNSKLYRVESAEFTDERISSLVAKTAEELVAAATAQPVSLSDLEEVKRRTVIYLKGCETASSLPSMAGLALSMGFSRKTLYACIERKQPKATAEWLEVCQDTFSDMLAASALRNDVNGIVSIFLQKATFGLRETVEIVAKAENPLVPDRTAAEIAAEYAALPED